MLMVVLMKTRKMTSKVRMRLKINYFTLDLDMVFEDDSKLLGLLARYSDSAEIEELKNQIVNYICTQTQDITSEMNQFKKESNTNVFVDPAGLDPMGDVINFYLRQYITQNFRWQVPVSQCQR